MFDLPFELPDGWEVKTVEQLIKDKIIEKPLDGNHGDTHPKSADYVEEGIPFVMASDLEVGRVNLDSCKFITEKQALTLRKGFSKVGDVLISHKATIGRTAIVQENEYDFIMLTPQVTYYRVKNYQKLNNVYLKAYFDSSFFQSILGLWAGAGSTRAYLGITAQLKLPVIVPPIDKQLSIANHVGILNGKIELNRQTNQTLEQIAQAIFKSWFVDFDPVKAKIQAKQNEQNPELAAMCALSGKTEDQLKGLDDGALKYLKTTAALFTDAMIESEIGDIPNEWSAIQLYDTAEYVNGGAFKAIDFSEDNSGLPIIKIAELKQGVYHGTKFTNKEVKSKYLISDDDVLYSWSGSPETSLEVFKWFGGDGWLNQHIFKLNFESEEQKYFTYYLLKHMKPLLISTAQQKQTTGLGHVTIADMKRMKLPYPTEEILKEFKGKISPLYEKGSICEKENICLIKIRNNLLPKLLNGEIKIGSMEVA